MTPKPKSKERIKEMAVKCWDNIVPNDFYTDLDIVLNLTINEIRTSFRELVQGIEEDFKGMQKCMEFTGWKYPCMNMECKRRIYCPLAFNGDLNNRFEAILASLDGVEIK